MKNKSQLQPVFLIGAGRSGTKFLRDVLGTSEEIITIPYDVGYVWRYGNERLSHDQLTPDMLNKRIIKYIKKTLPKLTKKPSKNTKFFIEKSVPNTLRPAFLKSIYPNAKFIHLIRDGRAVTESALRLWEQPPKRKYLLDKIKYFPVENYKYALKYLFHSFKRKVFPNNQIQPWGPRYKGIQRDLKNLPLETVCARQWKNCIEISFSQLSTIKDSNLLEVRYEDLMNDSKSIESICNFLGLTDVDDVIYNYENIVNKSHTDKWKEALTDEQLNLINSEIKTINNELGYI